MHEDARRSDFRIADRVLLICISEQNGPPALNLGVLMGDSLVLAGRERTQFDVHSALVDSLMSICMLLG